MKEYIITTSLYLCFLLLLISIPPSTCLNRIRFLKQQNNYSFSAKIPLFPQGYGALIPLSFGTPPQTLPFIIDTGSSLTWFPCGADYSRDPSKFLLFDPNLSNSSKNLTCNNPKYKYFVSEKSEYKCENCKANDSQNCLNPINYRFTYKKGFTAGTLISETLNIKQKLIPNIVVGCSSSFDNLLHGIVGLGRSVESLPSQIGIKKFSFCLSGTQYKDRPKESYLVLNGDDSGRLSYTPFHNSPFDLKIKDYYYVTLTDIIIGNKSIKVPRKFLVPDSDGNGGTILDSGYTFTFIERSIFQAVIREFEAQLGNDTFVGNTKNEMRCFDVSGKEAKALPKIAIRFKGGAMMKLPLKNYLTEVNRRDTLCLSFVTAVKGAYGGPTIILGNHVQRDFHIEHDLVKNRFGFREEKCI